MKNILAPVSHFQDYIVAGEPTDIPIVQLMVAWSSVGSVCTKDSVRCACVNLSLRLLNPGSVNFVHDLRFHYVLDCFDLNIFLSIPI